MSPFQKILMTRLEKAPFQLWRCRPLLGPPRVPWALLLTRLQLSWPFRLARLLHCQLSFWNVSSPRLALPFRSDSISSIAFSELSGSPDLTVYPWHAMASPSPLTPQFLFPLSCLTLSLPFRASDSVRKETWLCLWPSWWWWFHWYLLILKLVDCAH